MDPAALGLPVPFTDAGPRSESPRPLEVLARRLQSSDTAALEPFMQATQQHAFRLAYHMLGDWHAAQDALQDAYLTVLRDIRTLKSPQAITTWFTRIVTHRCLDMLRRNRPGSLNLIPEDLWPHQDGLAEETARRVAVQQALSKLSPQDRTVVVLRDILDLTYEEVATVLAIPERTVKSRLHEARRRMAKRLVEMGWQMEVAS